MKNFFVIIFILISYLGNTQDQMYQICPLKVGQTAPEGTIVDESNNQISLSNLVSQKPTVMIFYRGAWCGYCTMHLRELNDIKVDIEALGYQVVGITPDQASKLNETVVKTESEIPVYSDSKLEVIKAFGLNWKLDDSQFETYKSKYKLDLEAWSGENHHSLPVPAIFVIKDNVVQFQYVNPNYKIRLKPETLLAILKTL